MRMLEYLQRRLNPTLNLQTYLKQITETFIQYYGESQRDDIEQKFQNLFITCTQSPDGIKYNLSEILKYYAESLEKEFFIKTNIEYTEENVKKIFGDVSNPFEIPRLVPINIYIFCQEEEMSIYLKRANLKKIKPFIELFTKGKIDYSHLIKNNQEINEACQLFKKLKQKYQEFSLQFNPIKQYVEECTKLKRNLEKKYISKLIKEYENLFPIDEVQRYIKQGTLGPTIKAYIGRGMNHFALIEAFSKKSEAILNDDNTKLWQKNSILSDRIQFFKEIGINLGDSYETYENSLKAKELMPSAKLVEDINDSKEFLEMEMYNEYYTSLSEYQEVKRKLQQNNLLGKDDGYNSTTFINKGTYVTPNAKKQNDRYIMFPFVNINMDRPTEYIDGNIIHELNHVYELTLKSASNENIYYTCGWEEFDLNESDERKTSQVQIKRKYELFNEIINELISQEIAQLLHRNNIYIFNAKDEAKEIGGSGYERYRFLVQEFYDEFKTEILASRRGNIETIYNACGRENFNELNKLFNICFETWDDIQAFKLIETLKNGEITEDTKKYYEIIEKKDKILQNMIEYKNKLGEKENERKRK